MGGDWERALKLGRLTVELYARSCRGATLGTCFTDETGRKAAVAGGEIAERLPHEYEAFRQRFFPRTFVLLFVDGVAYNRTASGGAHASSVGKVGRKVWICVKPRTARWQRILLLTQWISLHAASSPRHCLTPHKLMS